MNGENVWFIISAAPGRTHLREIPDGLLYADEKGATPMTTWTNDELNMIGSADELQLASLRRDGSLRNPVTI